MKRLTSILLAIICLFSFVACNMGEIAKDSSFDNHTVSVNERDYSEKGGFDYLSSNTTDTTVNTTYSTGASVYQLGDVDKDGSITNRDLLILFKHLYSNQTYSLADERLGDANQDGEIDNADILTVLRNIYDPHVYQLEYVPGDIVDELNNNSHGEAYYIFEVFSFYGNLNGWNVDNRFDLYNTTGTKVYTINDKSDEQFYSLSREFDGEYSGLLRLELIANLASSNGGMYLSFQNSANDSRITITEKDGYLTLVGLNKLMTNIPVPSDPDLSNTYSIILDIDLDNNTAQAIINNKVIGTVDIAPNTILTKFVCGTTAEGTGGVSLYHAELNKNYPISDRFIVTDSARDTKPAQWNITGDFKIAAMTSERGYDKHSVVANSSAGSSSSAVRKFDKTFGKISFETMILLPEKTDGASVALTSGNNEVLKFETVNGKIVMGNTELHDYTANVWQTLHIDANTETGKADVYINGKFKATVDFTADYFDGVKIGFAPSAEATMWFDDVVLYNLYDYADYPSYPQVAESTDYNVGVNVCWLWRDQNSGEGWQVTSPFSEFDTYLGFYDEGLRETADWELKYMAEHGIDFLHACWYCPTKDQTSPIKKMRTSYSALHEGYMYAKYSNLVDFCLMWENGQQDVDDFEQFKEYIWKYWKEYYFSDERYARLDNKAVLTVWSYGNMKTAFGGTEEGVKEAIEFMNQELIEMGYDGLILLFAVQSEQTQDTYEKYNDLGFAGSYAYHYGPAGNSAEHQISANRTNYENSLGISHHVPTISIGFNDVARNDSRDPVISAEDHLKVCEDAKEILELYNTGTWKDNTVMISNWNEYSEGTYVFPCEQNGFTYLENIRHAFTNDTSDHSELDVKPTQNQIDRVTHMYPDNHSNIRWLQFEESDEQKRFNNTDGYVSVLSYANNVSAWTENSGIKDYSTASGKISGTSESTDFGIKTTFSGYLNAQDAPILHIRMQSSTTGSIEVFFGTPDKTSYDEERKVITKISTTDTMVDYYIKMDSNSYWKDSISNMRIDPGTTTGSNFVIELIEFMNYPEKDPDIATIFINHNEYSMRFDPIATSNGDYEVVGETRRGFYSLMMLYHEWNRFDQTLTIKTRKDKTIIFTVGSDVIKVNGIDRDLGYTFTLRDGLPVFRIKSLCDLLGYKYTVEGNKITIKSCSDLEYRMLGSRVEGYWDFNYAGFTDGWRVQNGKMELDGKGTLIVTPANGDPAIFKSVSFDASKYNQVKVGIKYFAGLENFTANFYFTTESDGAWNEEKSVKATYQIPQYVKEGNTVYIVFDLSSCDAWAGTILYIRIDAISGSTQTHEFDSVQLLKQ